MVAVAEVEVKSEPCMLLSGCRGRVDPDLLYNSSKYAFTTAQNRVDFGVNVSLKHSLQMLVVSDGKLFHVIRQFQNLIQDFISSPENPRSIVSCALKKI